MTGGAAFTFTELTEPTEVEAQSRNAPFGGAARAPPPRRARRLTAAVRSRGRFAFAHAVPERPARAARVPAFDAPRGEQADRRGARGSARRAARSPKPPPPRRTRMASAPARTSARLSARTTPRKKRKHTFGRRADRGGDSGAEGDGGRAGTPHGRRHANAEAREEELSGPRALETNCSYGSTGSRLFAKRSEGRRAKGDAIADERGTNANVAETETSESFAESRFAGESRKGERLDGTVRDRSARVRARRDESATKTRDSASEHLRVRRRRRRRRRRERRERAVSPRLASPRSPRSPLSPRSRLPRLARLARRWRRRRDVAGDGHRVSPDAGGSES